MCWNIFTRLASFFFLISTVVDKDAMNATFLYLQRDLSNKCSGDYVMNTSAPLKVNNSTGQPVDKCYNKKLNLLRR